MTTIGGVSIGRMGLGLMNFNWGTKQKTDAQAFECIKYAVDNGCNFLNSGEFYGQPERTAGLQMLARFFAAEPAYADRIFLSVKGGLKPDYTPDSSAEGLRQSVMNINAVLTSEGGKKTMDLFEPARVDQTRPIEDIMRDLLALRDEGHFAHIGFSEISSDTLRAAHRVGPVAAMEFEYSPWSLQPETNGVLAACDELQIAAIVYSPLGGGFLTGSINSRADIPEGDIRLTYDRYSEQNFEHNLGLVEGLSAIAKARGISSAQLALAWEIAQSNKIVPIPGSTRVEGIKEAIDAVEIELTEHELKNIREVIDSHTVAGGRYNDHIRTKTDVAE